MEGKEACHLIVSIEFQKPGQTKGRVPPRVEDHGSSIWVGFSLDHGV